MAEGVAIGFLQREAIVVVDGSNATARDTRIRSASNGHDAHRMPTAVILAAGEGSRLLRGSDDPPKPLTMLLGLTLVERAIRSCCVAGVENFVVVVGYRKEELVRYLGSLESELGVLIRVVENRKWPLGNGTSALAVEPYVRGSFFVLMSDHLFAPQFLGRLMRHDNERTCALVVDRDLEDISDLGEATKVRLAGGMVTAIGKRLTNFDGVDTGVFLCRMALFRALRQAAASGEHTLGDAVQLLAERGEVSWVPAGGLFWQDIDTPEDLELARSRLLMNRVVPSRRLTG